MGTAWLAATFLASMLVPLVEGLWPSVRLAQGPLTALALFPWLAFATLPRVRASAAGAAAEALFLVCLALPALALGLGLDAARGGDLGVLARSLGAALAALGLWVLAAEVAAASQRARTAYGVLWLLLVPGAAALHVALRWVPLRGSSGVAPAAGPTPCALVWCQRFAAGIEPASEAAQLAWLVAPPLLGALGMRALVRAGRP